MHQPPPPVADDTRLLWRLRLARMVLAWERLWPLLIWPVGLAGLFLAAALFDLLPRLPGWLHALVLSAFAGGMGYLTGRVWTRFRSPARSQAERRLERDSGLPHQPLAALGDRLAGGGDDPVTEALWTAHRRRMAAQAGTLRVGWPSPGMARRDPHGLRAAVLLLVVIAATVGWHDAGRRVERALTPAIDPPSLGPDAVEVWITPPSYTGAAPVLLQPDRNQDAATEIPAGSTVMAVVSGGWGTARLVIDGHRTPFQRQTDGGQRVETHVEKGNRLEIEQAGRTVAAWPIKVTADALPSVAFTRPPTEGERGRLRIDAAASDDYGLARVWVEIRRAESPDGEALEAELPLAATRPRAADSSSWHDFTPHPWAGLPVTVRPWAADGLGQQSAGEAVTLVLPERAFSHPTARALVALRRDVTEDHANAPDAAAALERIGRDPELFDDDLKVFLAMSAARHALATDAFDLGEVQDLLWNAALRLEDGDLADAERALEQARRALEEALDRDAPAAEIERLLAEFQQALARTLDALAQRMAESGAAPQAPDPDAAVVTDEDLRRMMEAMRDMAGTGARDALRQMLQNLDQLLSNLQTAPPQPVSPQAAQAMRDLDGVARRQQQLLDQSFQRGQQPGDGAEGGGGQPGSPSAEARGAGSGSGAGAAKAQEGLRRALGDVMKRLGDGLGGVPQALDEADQAMGRAAGALGEGDWDAAAQAQGEALEQLRQGSREAMEQFGPSGPGAMGLAPRDPLGRPMNGFGFGDDGTTAIPDRSEIQRSREILDELRRRAGEWSRPRPERDYLDRLLKQF